MAKTPVRRQWSVESLDLAMKEVEEENVSVRAAAVKFDIPKCKHTKLK